MIDFDVNAETVGDGDVHLSCKVGLRWWDGLIAAGIHALAGCSQARG